jgi:hypothetical protein
MCSHTNHWKALSAGQDLRESYSELPPGLELQAAGQRLLGHSLPTNGASR